MKKLISLTLVLVFLLSGCVTKQQTAKSYNDKVHPYVLRFADAVALASSTSRGALSGPVQELQKIKRETDALSIPECAVLVHQLFLDAMDSTISGFLSYMSNDDESIVAAYIAAATQSLKEYNVAREYICE